MNTILAGSITRDQLARIIDRWFLTTLGWSREQIDVVMGENPSPSRRGIEAASFIMAETELPGRDGATAVPPVSS